MDPITALSIVKNAGDLSKKLYEFGKTLKDRAGKQQVNLMLDQLHELKHQAWLLEEENRELREKLRFRSDEYVFNNPFYFHRVDPHQALCPKCFADHKASPMGKAGMNVSPSYRKCLVCGHAVQWRETGI